MHLTNEDRLRGALVVLWVLATSLSVVLALATRSNAASVKPVGGLVIVALTAFAAIVAAVRVRTVVILVPTFVVLTGWSVVWSWSVLRSDGSTAAVGALWIPVWALCMVLVAVALDWVVRRVVGPFHDARQGSPGSGPPTS